MLTALHRLREARPACRVVYADRRPPEAWSGRRARLGSSSPWRRHSRSSDQPMLVVARAVVRPPGGRLAARPQHGRPHSVQVKAPRRLGSTASAKACACHGSAKTGPSSSRGRPGKAVASDRLKGTPPQVDEDGVGRPPRPKARGRRSAPCTAGAPPHPEVRVGIRGKTCAP